MNLSKKNMKLFLHLLTQENPMIKILKRLADGIGKNLKIEFIPKNKLTI